MTQLLTVACGYALLAFMIMGNAVRLSLLVRLYRDLDQKSMHKASHLPALLQSRKARPTLP
jgi:hypothetical protein